MPCTSQIQGARATDTSTDIHDVASSLARAGSPKDPTGCVWPEAFLKDFESRIWMTYRSNFTPIPRNNTPEATSSMTLGVRLRSQLMDSQGFTSDTGWGCMIRSGQSLLANTLCILLLGRGDYRDRHTSRNRADQNYRLAKRPKTRGRIQTTCHVCRSPGGTLFNTSICLLRCRVMRKIPRGMVWAISNRPVHPVRPVLSRLPQAQRAKLTKD